MVDKPIDMLLFCPKCNTQHIDKEESLLHEKPSGPNYSQRWRNPPHKSHFCITCGCIWRPADVPTNGVACITTRGAADSWDIEQHIRIINNKDVNNEKEDRGVVQQDV